MKHYTEQQYKEAYSRKKADCDKRKIQFDFTEEEYAALYKARNLGKLRCAYTGKEFILDIQSDLYPELDRIDNHKSYNKHNCVFVTKKAHKIKTKFIENCLPLNGQSSGLISIYHRISKILEDQRNVEEMMKPYYEIYNSIKKEIVMEKPTYSEKTIAKLYYQFVNSLEDSGVGEEDVLISYAQFKRKLCVKTDAFTNKPLPIALDSRKLYIKDKTRPVSNSNVVCSTKELVNALDLLQGTCKLTTNDLKRVGKTLSK